MILLTLLALVYGRAHLLRELLVLVEMLNWPVIITVGNVELSWSTPSGHPDSTSYYMKFDLKGEGTSSGHPFDISLSAFSSAFNVFRLPLGEHARGFQ